MKLLLDTVTFLWLAWDDPRLSPLARERVLDPGCTPYLSAASAWEIAVKHALGKLPLPQDPETLVPELRVGLGLAPLPVDEVSALQVVRLPWLHRDPFDRMLICQSIAHAMVLVTPDAAIRRYPIRTLW